MTYPYTRRGVIKFFLLGLVTLGIYDLVCLNHVRKEINTILGDADKKVPPFWIAWIFGWITLGIVPLVWACNVATRLGLLQEAMGISKPKTSFASLFNWCFFGVFILVGPWIGFHRFFAVLNQIEAGLNQGAPVSLTPEAAETKRIEDEKKILNVPMGGSLSSPDTSTLIVGGQDVSVNPDTPEAPAPAPAKEPVLVVPEKMSDEVVVVAQPLPRPEKPKPYSYVPPETPTPSAEVHQEIANDETPKAFKKAPAPIIKKWQVRYADQKDAIKYFASEEEAIAFAKSLAMTKGVSYRVNDKAKPIK